jgi:hypothetical protein
MLANVQQKMIQPVIEAVVAKGARIHTDEYDIYARLPAWGYRHETGQVEDTCKKWSQCRRLGGAGAFGDFSDYPPGSHNRDFAPNLANAEVGGHGGGPHAGVTRSLMSEDSSSGLVVNASSAHRGHSSACTCGHCRTGTARYGQSSVLLGAEVQAVKHSRAIADAARSSGKSC